ncbi:DUF72 domain-containing protein [Vagococcus sp. BWB3-3]|uniref:DUF72 domain-containing protein n=1 Tax=Vagococcus allomyrinae TaxID=2794353 RepID=A0A940SZ58_9ENTE|nr:DUF72 domain-containing protein [Vagococcus allomyrinae]MBP1044083.1 DUF72 domain-containing protein [Vagococcus allomyrinae]
MINIGLTTWSEHTSLLKKIKPTLGEYASKLPVVEIDNPFYGIPSPKTFENWESQTPDGFKFLVKANQAMTLQTSWEDYYESERSLYEVYRKAIAPLSRTNKLEAILCQFPAMFDCTKENILHLRRMRHFLGDLPLSIELRHPSWYEPQYLQQTLAFMRAHEFILLTIDEPQVQDRSIPFYPIVTHPDKAIFRLHGRYKDGWLAKGDDWRKRRTLYRYNQEELEEIKEAVIKVASQVKTTTIIFNNNSGGDAADNALALKELLAIDYSGLNPEQIDLF